MKCIFIILIIIIGIIGCGEKVDTLKSEEVEVSIQSSDINKNKVETNIVEGESSKPIAVLVAPNFSLETVDSGYLMGGLVNNRWTSVEELDIYPTFDTEINGDNGLMKASDLFYFYSSKGLVESHEIKETSLRISPASGEILLTGYFDPIKSDEEFLIGISGDWNALPRTLEQSENGKLYNIDLDDDGVQESIVVEDIKIKSTDYNDNEIYVDGIRIVLVKNNQKIILADEILEAENMTDYYLKALDLNGDNNMEIILYLSGHDDYFCAYEIKENSVKPVLYFYEGN